MLEGKLAEVGKNHFLLLIRDRDRADVGGSSTWSVGLARVTVSIACLVCKYIVFIQTYFVASLVFVCVLVDFMLTPFSVCSH